MAKTEIFFDQVQANLDGMEKKVTFGSFAWLLQLFIAPMLNELKSADPRKRYDFIEIESIDLVSQLQDFKIDVGYAYAEPFERADIAAVPIAQIENKVVVPKNHFWRNSTEFIWSNLAGLIAFVFLQMFLLSCLVL